MALTADAVSTSETPVSFYDNAQRSLPEDSQLHTHGHENLKSPKVRCVSTFLLKSVISEIYA
jgi:hypothetical protein